MRFQIIIATACAVGWVASVPDPEFALSGVFKSEDPPQTAKAIVQAVKHWRDAEKLARIAADFSGPMRGLRIDAIPEHELLQKRGW